jgi:hypothetical protein
MLFQFAANWDEGLSALLAYTFLFGTTYLICLVVLQVQNFIERRRKWNAGEVVLKSRPRSNRYKRII